MIDPVQAVLLFVILLLSVLFVILGVQVFLILKDLRVTVQKTNKILDDVEEITENISEPVNFIRSVFVSSNILSIISKLFNIGKEKSKNG